MDVRSFRMTLLVPILCGLLGCGGGTSLSDIVDSVNDDSSSSSTPTTLPQGTEALVNTETVRSRSLAVCLNCHNGVTQAPDLRTAQAVKNNASLIQFQVNSNRMPPPNSGFPLLSDCQREILNKWVELGTPDSSTFKVNQLTNCPAGLIDLDLELEDLEHIRILEPEFGLNFGF